MRIAFIVNVFPLLSETFILNQITGLIDRGHEVQIFAQFRGDTFQMHRDVKKYKLLDCTYYSPLLPKNKILRILKGILLVLANLHKGPVLFLRSTNVFKYGRQAASLRLLYEIIPYIGKEPYDIIQCHFGPNGLFAQLLRELGAIRGRIVTTFHAYDIYKHPAQYGQDIYKRLFAKGDLFCAISEHGAKQLSILGCPKQKLMIHHMGVDTNKLVYRQGHIHRNGDVSILTIARLVEKKGLEYGIRAIAELKRSYPHISYTVAGDGPLRGHIENLISELGLEETITLVGWKRQDDIAELLEQADILLAPSVTVDNGDKEGIPVAIMEAMGAGLSVVSTLHSGIPELVQEGISGFLVPERDIDATAEKLIYLIEHPEIRPEMGRAGRSYVEANYDINKLNGRLVEIYKKLLDDR